MLYFGMPMGSMPLLDEVGIDVALDVAHTLAASFRDRMAVSESLARMVQAGLLGRKAGRGFYLHAKGKEAEPNPQATTFRPAIAGRQSPVTNQPSRISTYQDRMVFLMLNEAARCLEEQIVTETEDVDFAMIMGTGFAPFRGGPLRYAESLGLERVVEAMKRLEDTGASYFSPCSLLRKLADERKRFYPEQGNHK